MPEPLRVASIVKTCEACPAQWEGHTIDLRPVYVRFRWGYLSVRIARLHEHDAVGGREVFGKQIGGGLAGSMTGAELAEHTAGVIEWPNTITADEDYPDDEMSRAMQELGIAHEKES